ncbi:MAG: zinc-dependent metalloprotease family protein [Bacteroidota bacterium]
MSKFFKTVPSEESILSKNKKPALISIPLPNGTTAKFSIWESSTLAPELAKKYSGIKTFTGQGIDDPSATIKVDWTPLGFHAMILSPLTTAIFIDNYEQGDNVNYISYYKSDFIKRDAFVETVIKRESIASPAQVEASICIGTQLRTYRLAVACTGEYAKAATGKASPTIAEALGAIVTTVNRVNGVYEKEIALRMVLVANDTNVVFTDPTTDPFNGNDDAEILIGESQSVIDTYIGNANYDIGHTFSTGGGGYSDLGVICITGRKASSITGSPKPVGDPYDIDYVAHEMGHALGAEHTFNSTNGFCGGNGSKATNAEPGSGSTIMAYAGICLADDLQPHTDAQFHALSLDQIETYIINSSGSTCAVVTNTGNTPPVVNAGANYIIPKSTPFILTGTATDANGDALTYSWEQIDKGGAYSEWNEPAINSPLFRSFPPVATGVRHFPKLSDVINNTTTIGEILPDTGRALHFRLTARDNKAGGGGVCFDSVTTTVSQVAGPFRVTYPNTTGIIWTSNESRTILWDVANTNASPVNCTNVSIQLSIDGGNTYPITLVASTPNDGSEIITVPLNVTTQGRIRIMSVGNIFYDISNNNFRIEIASPSFNFSTPDTVKMCGINKDSVKIYTNSVLGYNQSIDLAASGNPAGTNISISKGTILPGDSVTVTLDNASSLVPGVYNVTILGVSGSINKTVTIPFLIGVLPVAPVLTSPVNGATGLGNLPAFNWLTVPTTTNYILEISTSSTFATIVQSIPGITQSNYTLTTPLASNTIYYWRVRSFNPCGISLPSNVSVFRTGITSCTTYTSTDVPKTISQSGTPTVNSILNIANGTIINDINVVGLVGGHTYVTDLTVSLISPSSTTLVLFDQICNDGNRYRNYNLSLDDQAILTTFPCPPTGALTIKPASPLSIFNNEISTGTWTLRIKDNFGGDGGSLTGWGLQICSITNTPLDLEYTFNGTGNWDDASNWLNSSIPPATLLPGSKIIIDPLVSGECYLNVTYTLAAGSTITVMTDKKFTVPGNLTIEE